MSLLRVAEAQPQPGLVDRARALRMRCKAPGCGFDGTVPRRTRPRVVRWWSRRRWRRLQPMLRSLARGLAILGLCSLVAGVGAALGAAWHSSKAPSLAEQRAALPEGEYHDGDPLPSTHPLHPGLARNEADNTSLDLRGACVWGRPGRDPYRGSVAEALRTARLPDAVQVALLAKIAANEPDDRLTIANNGIRATRSADVYAAAGFAMTYGRTLCLETRVNFPAGHTEPAELYEARDARGRRYAIMVPQVCGNVSFIARVSGSGETDARYAHDVSLPTQLTLRSKRVGDGEDDSPRAIPEPGTLLLLVAAGLAWLVAAARRRRRSDACMRQQNGP